MSNSQIIKAPQKWTTLDDSVSIFFGGSIEMGKAENWQEKLTNDLISKLPEDVKIINPRRDYWDSSWEQSINNEKFKEQVEWELYSQECCDIVIYYFAKNTMSPITLLELGAFINKKNIVVYVDPEYQRRGNVEIFCKRYGLDYYLTYEDFKNKLIEITNVQVSTKK